MKKIIFDDISNNWSDLTFYYTIKPLAKAKLTIDMRLELYYKSDVVRLHDNFPLTPSNCFFAVAKGC